MYMYEFHSSKESREYRENVQQIQDKIQLNDDQVVVLTQQLEEKERMLNETDNEISKRNLDNFTALNIIITYIYTHTHYHLQAMFRPRSIMAVSVIPARSRTIHTFVDRHTSRLSPDFC
jgi:hypothetical protein